MYTASIPHADFTIFTLLFSVTYQDKTWDVLVRKQVRYGYAHQTDFDLRPLACKKVTNVKIGL